jgi:hypothetical protein
VRNSAVGLRRVHAVQEDNVHVRIELQIRRRALHGDDGAAPGAFARVWSGQVQIEKPQSNVRARDIRSYREGQMLKNALPARSTCNCASVQARLQVRDMTARSFSRLGLRPSYRSDGELATSSR